jgi:hypothetical protein
MREPNPFLLTSPGTRSGTTLLQRLLCSSENAICYGEEIGKDLELTLQVLASREMLYRHSRPRFEARLQGLLAGDGDGWLIDLMPPLDDYLGALRTGALAPLAACGANARAIGRETWGFKYPGWPPPLVRMLQQQVPGLRVVYAVRGLADTVRSAKAWHGFTDERDTEDFCAQWLAHRRFMRAWAKEHPVLEVRHEALVAGPADTLAALAGFLGVRGMDAGVLSRRINSAPGSGPPLPDGAAGYLAPATLSAREQDCVAATEAAAALD